MGGDEDLGDRGGLDVIEAGGNRHRHAVVDARHLGIRAAADDAHHAVADLPALHVRAHGDHVAGDFQAHDGRIAEVRPAVAAAALRQVGAVDAGGAGTHQQVVRPWQRLRHFADPQDVRRAERVEYDGFHDGSFTR